MSDPVKAASVGIGWWSDVVADAVQKTDAIEIVTCFTRNSEKRANFAKKYGCRESDQPTGWSDGRREAPQNRSGTLPPPRPSATGRSDQARAWGHERREAPQNRSGTLPPAPAPI